MPVLEQVASRTTVGLIQLCSCVTNGVPLVALPSMASAAAATRQKISSSAAPILRFPFMFPASFQSVPPIVSSLRQS